MTAVIVPAFFHNQWTITHTDIQEQIESWGRRRWMTRRVKNRIPSTIGELMTCLKKRKCIAFKKGVFNHVSFPPCFHS